MEPTRPITPRQRIVERLSVEYSPTKRRVLTIIAAGLLVFLVSVPSASAFGWKDVVKMHRAGIDRFGAVGNPGEAEGADVRAHERRRHQERRHGLDRETDGQVG